MSPFVAVLIVDVLLAVGVVAGRVVAAARRRRAHWPTWPTPIGPPPSHVTRLARRDP